MSLGYSHRETETNPSNKNRFAWVCLAFVGGFCVGLGFFLWVGFGFFNKAMEYLQLRVFAKGNHQNAEKKALCTRLTTLKDKKITGNNG